MGIEPTTLRMLVGSSTTELLETLMDTTYQRNMPSQGTLLVAFYFYIMFTASSTAGDIYQVGSPCSCTLRGHVYNLAPLASSNGYPKFEIDFKGRNFAYNPCIPFTIKAECEDVAICSWVTKGQTFTALGKQSGVQCQLEGDEEELVFQVPNKLSEKTFVRMKCNQKLKGLHDALFSVINDDNDNTILEVEHYCCCPDACPLGKPLPTDKTPEDNGKLVATILAAIFGVCTTVLVGIIVYFCWRWHGQRDRENEHILPRNGPREN